MTIIKKKFNQTIFIGLLFAFISGALGFFVQNSLFKNINKDSLKQMFIINEIPGNVVQSKLRNLNQKGYLGSLSLSQELFRSIQFAKVKYQNNRSLIKCSDISITMIDNSIFLESSLHSIEFQEEFENCLKNFINFSFERLKSKFDINNIQQFYNSNLYTNEEITNEQNDKIELENNINNQSLQNRTRENCKRLDIIYNQLIRKFNKLLNEDSEFLKNKSTQPEQLVEMYNLYQSLITATSFNEFCKNNNKNYVFDQKNYNLDLNQLIEEIKYSSLDKIFTIEKISKLQKNSLNQYLSKKNILITFSIFGFIFGILLFYNFGISNNRNE